MGNAAFLQDRDSSNSIIAKSSQLPCGGAERRILRDSLPNDVWFLIYDYLRPHDLVHASGVSILWRQRVRLHRTVSSRSSSCKRLALSAEEGEPPIVLGFEQESDHLWVVQHEPSSYTQKLLVEYDRDLKRIFVHSLQHPSRFEERFKGCSIVGGKVSVDSREAVLLYRRVRLRYPWLDTVYFASKISLKIFEETVPRAILEYSYAEDPPPMHSDQVALLFSARFFVFAVVQSDDTNWCGLIRITGDVMSDPGRIRFPRSHALLSVGLSSPSSFVAVTQEENEPKHSFITTISVREHEIYQAPHCRLYLPLGVRRSSNFVRLGSLLYALIDGELVAMHPTGHAYRMTVSLGGHSQHVYVRGDGAVLLISASERSDLPPLGHEQVFLV